MVKEHFQKWIEAAKILNHARDEKVRCPECGQADLTVRDVAVGGTSVSERYLACPKCNAINIVRKANRE